MKRRLNRLREGALFAFLSCLLLSALLILLPLDANANTTGGDDDRGVTAEMRLTPDVDTTGFAGDAKISIPIVVPPGRTGMVPSLTLSYSSSAGNGWIGTGWNIETGFIQRQTKFGLNYADDTSFAFRSAGASGDLVSLGSGNFGMKIETEFSKFQYTSGYWQVTARDGKRYYYGQTSDARQTNSAGQIFKWLLNRVEDPNGNYITFSYISDARETYVYEIRYTGNSSGLSPTSLVRFHYMGRNDALTYGIGRDLVNVNKLLKAIEVKAASEATSVRVYGFEYAEASHTREPILNKIQQYDNGAYYYASTGQIIGGNALPPIVITADSSQTTIPYGTHSVEPQSKVDLNYKFVIGDFNGDNLTDYMWLHTYLDERVVYLRQGNGSFNSGTYSSGGGVYRSGWKFVTGDFDGDGKTDYMILSINTNERFVYRSNGAGNFLSAVRTAGDVSYNLYATWNLTTGDFNGDGKTDIMWINPTNNKRTVYLSAGNGQFSAGLTSGENVNYSAYQFTTGDFNGDGRTDYMWVDMYQNKRAVYISSGTGGFSAPVSTNDGRNYSLTTWNVTTGDFNGDGKTDYMWVRGDYNQCAVYLGLGNGGFAPVVLNTLGSTYSNVWQLHAGDFNGDGKTDIILVKNAEDKRMLHLSRGDGYFLPAVNNSFTTGIDYNSYTHGIWDFVTGDYNGDGKTDYMYINKYKRKRYVALANPTAPQGLVSSIKNSTGGTTSFQYTHSTNFINTYLPYVMPLVTVVSLNDGLNNVSTRQYTYAQGKHDISLREFLGFGYVRTVQPDSSIVETTYHQDEYLKGRIKNTTLKNPGGAILMSRSNAWSAAVMSGRWRFVKLDQSTTVYDNYSSYYTTLDYLYDSTHGNVTRIVTSGTSAEPVTTIFGYANYSGWLWRPTSITVTGSSTGTVRQTTFDYYSGTGNLRLQKNWDLTDDSKSQVTTMEYYSNGNLWRVRDPRGNATTTEYETVAYTFPSKVTKPATDGNRVAHVTQYLNYDYRIGRPRTVVDENSRTTSYSYEGFGRLAQVDYPDGGQTQMGYADQAFPRYEVTSIKEDAANRINKYKYFDGFDRNIQTVTFGEGGKRIASKTYYDVMGRVRHVSGPYFNGSGSPAYPLNEPSSYPYVSKAYDYRGRVTSVTNPDDEYGTTTTSFAYGGFAVTMTDPDGRIKTEYKDHLGRTIQITEDAVSGGLNLNTSYAYNAAGDLLTIRDAANNLTIIAYNSLGQKRSVTDPDRGMRSFAYDLNGNLVTQKDAKGNVFTFDYDELNRVRTKKAVFYAAPTCPNGGAYSSASGKCEQDAITTYTCPLGGAGYGSAETCNANCTNVGSCVQHTHTGPFHCSKYGGYDADHCYTGCSADGSCNDLTCPESLPTVLGADTCPPETDMTPAGYYSKSSYIVGIDNNYICSGDWYALFKYDSVNHWACSLSDAEYYNDATCTAACRQTAACSGPAYSCQAGWTPSGTKCIQDPVIPTTTEPTVTWTYDSDSITNGRGRLYSVTNTKVASTILGYDGMGRKLGEKKTYEDDAAEYATRYAYDLSGKMTGMTYPDSYQVIYAYHPGSDLLASVRGVSDNREYGRFSLYESTGKIGQIDHANGAATRHTFGPKSTRLYGIVTTSAGQDLQNLGYRYTRAADLYQIKDYLGDVTYTYTYDGLHRLKGETNTGSHPANTYDYDAIGNITRKTLGDNSYVYSYAYPQKHAVSSIAVNGGEPNAFSYDANGNMTEGADFTDTSAVGARGVVYNMDNMPGRITYTKGGNTAVTEFLYDGAGLRAKKTSGGSATYYVHPGYEVKDGVVTKYITAADMKIAQIRGAQTAYYHRDHLSSSTVMTDDTGAKLESTEYAPYGTIRFYTGSRSVTDYRYTGKELDMETGLYYYGARYYDPMIGRFITPDPALSLYIPAPNDNRRLPNGGVFNPVTLNPYAYANNNPMKYVDPDGLWTEAVHYFKTIDWITSMKVLNSMRIERIAAANAAVDDIIGSKSYMPVIGDPGRHFNVNPEGMLDSRDVYAKVCLAKAIEYQLVANALAKSGKMDQARENEMLADQWLGEGTHSLQDIFAHAKKYSNKFIGIHYHDGPEALTLEAKADDTKVEPSRIEETEKATKQYIQDFLNATKEASSNSPDSSVANDVME